MKADETTIAPADLRAWRMLAGLTQEGAAMHLGVPLPTYIRWERGLGIRHPRVLALAMGAIEEGVPPWQAPADLALPGPRRRGRPRRKPVVI